MNVPFTVGFDVLTGMEYWMPSASYQRAWLTGEALSRPYR